MTNVFVLAMASVVVRCTFYIAAHVHSEEQCPRSGPPSSRSTWKIGKFGNVYESRNSCTRMPFAD
jgi:hypothetical protein